MQRFNAALTTGYWPDNPEDLVRDNDGEFVLYKDASRRIEELESCILRLADAVLEQHDNGDYYSFIDINLQNISEDINRIL